MPRVTGCVTPIGVSGAFGICDRQENKSHQLKWPLFHPSKPPNGNVGEADEADWVAYFSGQLSSAPTSTDRSGSNAICYEPDLHARRLADGQLTIQSGGTTRTVQTVKAIDDLGRVYNTQTNCVFAKDLNRRADRPA
jgi:hypothetical protein